MNGVTWQKKPQCNALLSSGGFQWEAYVGENYIGVAYNDGWSSVDCVPVNHGSIHLAALRVQRAAEAYAKKEGSL